MLIPIGDVPAFHAARKPADTIAVQHGDATLTWAQLEANANMIKYQDSMLQRLVNDVGKIS